MAEPRPLTASAATGGFTLVEMMVALGILLLGITSLLAALSSGVGQRRGADATIEASLLAEEVLQRVRHGAFAGADGGSILERAPNQLGGSWPGFPGMRWQTRFADAPERPDLVLCTIAIRWMEEGEFALEEFHALIPRQEPLGVRVQRFREHNGQTR